MSDAEIYIPTGEKRKPEKGEYFEDGEWKAVRAAAKFQSRSYRILRRVVIPESRLAAVLELLGEKP